MDTEEDRRGKSKNVECWVVMEKLKWSAIIKGFINKEILEYRTNMVLGSGVDKNPGFWILDSLKLVGVIWSFICVSII